jgi:hypothetical protein
LRNARIQVRVDTPEIKDFRGKYVSITEVVLSPEVSVQQVGDMISWLAGSCINQHKRDADLGPEKHLTDLGFSIVKMA